MSTLAKIENNDDFKFLSNTIRPDGMVSITALSSAYRQATGKRKDSRDWLVTLEAKESIAYLERVTGIPVTGLVIAEHGVGTWVHPDLAEIFAQWVSVEYRFAVVQLIRKAKEHNIAPVQKVQRQLPTTTIQEYMIEARAWGLDTDPLIKSLITQRLAEELGSKSLPSAINTQVVLTVRASELGYSQEQIGTGSQLGSFVAQRIQPLGKTQHGRYSVNVYELTAELDACIHAYFGEII